LLDLSVLLLRGGEGQGKEGAGEEKGREGVIPVLVFPHFEPWLLRYCGHVAVSIVNAYKAVYKVADIN